MSFFRLLILTCVIISISLVYGHIRLDDMSVDDIRSSSIAKSLDTTKESALFSVDAVSASPQCLSFAFASVNEALGSTCGNAVDYAFYLPAGVSLEFLETTARGLLSNAALAILPNACQVALKKQVCSNVYLKCPTGIDLTDTSTYNFNIFSDFSLTVPMPFERPCKSVCTDTNTQCLGVLGLLGMTNDCDATTDYSQGAVPASPYTYDSTNNAAQCNAMTASFAIGASSEPYVMGTTGACYGIVDNVYIPASQYVSPLLAPMLPPYVIQSIIDSQLSASFNALPAWVSESCHIDLRKYFCRSYLIKPTSITYGVALTAAGAAPYLASFIAAGVNVAQLVTESVVVPSYPHRDVCESYTNTCGGFIELSGQASLIANCSAVSKVTGIAVQTFPTAAQSILILPIPLTPSDTLYVPFSSSPDTVASASETYSTVCPEGFVVPDVPDDSRITWIPGTGCANSCRIQSYTNTLYDQINNASKYLTYLGVPISLATLVVWVADPKLRGQHFIIMIAFFYLISSIANSIYVSAPLESSCSNNAVQIDGEDSITNICASTAMVNISFLSGCVCAWSCYFTDLALKARGMNTEKLKSMQIATVIIAAAVITILWGSLGVYGYAGGASYCLLSLSKLNENIYDLPILFMPLMLATFSAFFTFAYALITVMRRGGAINPNIGQIEMSGQNGGDTKRNSVASVYNDTSSSTSSYKSSPLYQLRVPFFFFLIFFTAHLYMFSYRMTAYKDIDSYYHGFEEWATCAFLNFDGTNAWQAVCGDSAYDQMPYTNMFAYYIIPSALPIIFGTIFLLGRQNFYENPLLSNNMVKMTPGAIISIKSQSNGKVITVGATLNMVEVNNGTGSPLHKNASGKVFPV